MAVDFSKLPPEKPVPNDEPSRLVWTVVFFVIVLAGVFAVLLLWPEGEPTQTPWFWTCVTVYPIGVATFVVSRRYSVYEGRRLDAIAWNDARNKYVEGVFDQASRPLAVLVATNRFSSDEKENELRNLLDGSLTLEPRMAAKPDAPPVNARWFEMLHKNENDNRSMTDEERRRHVLSWAFGTLLADVEETVRRLPEELKLSVQLALPGLSEDDEALSLWDDHWEKSGLRPVRATVSYVSPGLMRLDAWLDRVNKKLDQEARLFVFVRLNPVLQAVPPEGSAEAAVAILVVPDSVQRKFNLPSAALVCRPNGIEDCSPEIALARALQWGHAEPSDIKRIWQSGLDGNAANAATKAVVKAGIGVKASNVDYMVGHAGDVAPWLALACASNAVAQADSVQLIATGSGSEFSFSVMRSNKPV